MTTRLLALSALAALLPSAPAQQLLHDVDPSRAAAAPSVWSSTSAVANGLAFLSIQVREFGTEPWVTDGTAAGTRLLADLSGEPQGSVPQGFAPLNGGVVFHAATSRDVWWSDGTAANTVRLGGIEPSFGPPTPVGNLAYYALGTSGVGIELWATDGTPAGTRFVADLNPGSRGSEPSRFVDAGGIAYCRARLPGGWRLVRSDGTGAGTFEVGSGLPYGDVAEIAVVGSTVFFSTDLGSSGELWKTDGTPAGTTRVSAGFTRAPRSLTPFGGSLLFTGPDVATGAEPWISDGTSTGTRLVLDLLPGAGAGILAPANYRVIGSTALFSADDGQHGLELWRTDGTGTGTALVQDIQAGSRSSFPLRLRAVGSRVFFLADDGVHGEELWVTDGSTAGTQLIGDLNRWGGSNATPLTELNGELLFAADDGRVGLEPWITDGTAAGTRLIADLASVPGSSNPSGFTRYGRRALFAADDGRHGSEPWITDHTRTTTRMLLDLEPGSRGSSPRFLGEWKGRAWFVAWTVAHGSELWSTDGTAAGTAMLADIAPGDLNSRPSTFLPLDEVALFVANDGTGGEELWVTDGTAGGTSTIDLDPTTPSNPRQLVRLGDLAYFVAREPAHGYELWRSDGTTAGTSRVSDIVLGPDSPTIRSLTASHGHLYFAGATLRGPREVPVDLEPWISDGTGAGTRRLADLAPGLDSSSPGSFIDFAGRTWFAASRPNPANPFGFSQDLFATDGTAAGTVSMVSGLASSGALVPAGERIFFQKGGEIWSTDGTPAGTVITREIWPGPTSSQPQDLTPAGTGTLVVFTARDTSHGRELYVSDGTAAGTRVIRDVRPGIVSSNPAQVTRVGDAIYLSADDATSGIEPYVVPLADIGGALAEPLARGCPGVLGTPRIGAGGIPRLGEPAFTITLEHARPMAPTYFFLGTDLLPGADVGRCVPAIAPPAIAAAVPVDAAGRGSITLAVPASPSLQGVELLAQWLIFDPSGGMWSSLALSDVLDIVVGS